MKKHEYVSVGIPVWTMNNVGANEFVEEGCLYITPQKFEELAAYRALNGDILISRAGTVGRMAIVRTKHTRSIIHTNIIRLSLNDAKILPIYFVALMTWFAPRVARLKRGQETEIRTAAKEYPTCDVGLVLKRRVGEPFAIDIDTPGVIERMAREPGQTLPATYTVLSRPVTAPYKRHIFFRHTHYSYEVFGKNVNAGEYDLIGTGTHALQVVAEGCVRPDTGEVRTGNGLPIADCPDWLANWLISDSTRLKNERTAEARRRNAERRAALKLVAEDEAAERRGRTGYDKHARADRYRYLVSKARTLSNAGVAKERLPAELLSQYVADYGEIRDDDPNGWPLQDLKEKIQGIISNPDLKRGNPPPIRPRMSTFPIIKRQPETNWERRVKIARALPETVTSSDVYARFGLDSKNPKDKKIASRVMKAAGFVAKRGRRRAVWVKVGCDAAVFLGLAWDAGEGCQD